VTPLRVASYAKINLGLEVLALRSDGYHELRTLFQTIDLHDDITLEPKRKGIVVRCDHPGVPTDDTNLAARAAAALAKHGHVTEGIEIRIKKRIPVAGGLGGGSSNAAATLLGLDRLWGLGLGPAGLHPLARRLGADVPFFLMGGTALGLARGDEVYPLHRQIRGHVVVVDAGRPVSTAAVFRRVDECLTPREKSYTIFLFVSRHLEGESAFSLLSNDLEGAALSEAPDLREAIERTRGILRGAGCSLAALSGSGSSFFGFFEDARRAGRARRALEAAGLRTLGCRTLSLEEYRRRWSRTLGRAGARVGRTR
jgi:4-diphosphocytidyl-2-C-methyl-D-erythritol kinase